MKTESGVSGGEPFTSDMKWEDDKTGRVFATWQVVLVDLDFDSVSSSPDSESALFKSLSTAAIGHVHTCYSGRRFTRIA